MFGFGLQLCLLPGEPILFRLKNLAVFFERAASSGKVPLLFLEQPAFVLDFLPAAVPNDAVGLQLGSLFVE